MAKDIQCEVRNIINEIVEKAADGNYIYRGEPERYTQSPFDGKVSSGLWRQLQSTFTLHDRINFDYDVIQESYLSDARQYEDPYQDDFELASQLQHVGGKTNLIDFTKDYLVALFFACDGAHNQPGRVILFELTEDKRSRYKIEAPQNPKNRVDAQKSIFVRHQKGIIEKGDIEKIIYIQPSFKQPILTYLRKYHSIYTQTIYNDLQGYIKHQKNHHKAYSEYGRGQLSRRNNPGRIVSVNGRPINDTAPACTAIDHFSNAIELYPDFVQAYYARAQVYLWIDDFDKAIKDYTSVIEINPDYASAYVGRGQAYSNKGCYARASDDFKRAIELGDNSARKLLKEEQKKGAPE